MRKTQAREWAGAVPYGWSRPKPGDRGGCLLVLEPHEARLLREAVQRVLGGASVREVAHGWNDRGERTRSEGWWRDTSLRRMLRHPYLAGWLPDGADVVRDEEGLPAQLAEPLVSAETYERLQAALSGRKPGRSNHGPAMLAGLARCAECGGSMHGRHSEAQSASYYCSRRATQGGGACPGVAVSQAHLEAYVTEWLRGLLTAPYVRDLAEAHREAERTARAEVERLRRALSDLESDRYEGGGYKGNAGARSFRARHAELSEALDKAEAVLLDVEASPLPVVLRRARSGRLPWSTLSTEELRTLALATIDRVEVSKGQRGRPFDGSRVTVVPIA